MRRRGLLVGLAGILASVAPAAGPASASVIAPCHAAVQMGVLPVWARGGFSDPRPRAPHVVGRDGRIAAILFGYPLRASTPGQRTNKILWVGRSDPARPAALWIHAQRMEGRRAVGAPVGRVLPGGPGPSVVDMPAPGCWRLTLSWSGRQDTLDLAYGTGR
jgi:hypothetical protein